MKYITQQTAAEAIKILSYLYEGYTHGFKELSASDIEQIKNCIDAAENYKPTNGDLYRLESNEKLANDIKNTLIYCGQCPVKDKEECRTRKYEKTKKGYEHCRTEIAKWFCQEAKDV